MPRSYRHIEEYETEILRMKSEGKTRKEIGDALGFSPEQVHGFINRYNRKQEKLAAWMVIHRKGRPPKGGYEVTEESKTDSDGIPKPVRWLIYSFSTIGLFYAVRTYWGSSFRPKKSVFNFLYRRWYHGGITRDLILSIKSFYLVFSPFFSLFLVFSHTAQPARLIPTPSPVSGRGYTTPKPVSVNLFG